MNKQKIWGITGWVAAFAIGSVMFTTGFQGTAAKTGNVDMTRLIADSKRGQRLNDLLRNEFTLRQGILEFMNSQRILTQDQAVKLRTLTLKKDATAAEKTELENVKEAVKADAKKFNDLNRKPTPTEADRTLLTDYNNRIQLTEGLLGQWQQEFQNELLSIEEDERGKLMVDARKAVSEVSKRGGYSVVFTSQAAVYAANDVTDEAIKEIDK